MFHLFVNHKSSYLTIAILNPVFDSATDRQGNMQAERDRQEGIHVGKQKTMQAGSETGKQGGRHVVRHGKETDR